MSSHSRIYLRLKEEDKGKTKQAIPSHFNGANWKYNTPCVVIPNDANYISIYCHWDGYPSGVGYELFTYWNNYNDILNMLLVGDLSYVKERSIQSYYAWRGENEEPWDRVQPNFTERRNLKEQYNYCFDYETNKWYIGAEDNWQSLEDYLREKEIID